ADIDRLEARLRTWHGEHRHEARHGGEAVEEAVFRAEHYGGTKHRDIEVLRLTHRLLAPSLAALIFGWPLHIGAERAHVQHAPHARGAAGGDDSLRQLGMGALEVAVHDADQVHDRVLAAHEALEHRSEERRV